MNNFFDDDTKNDINKIDDDAEKAVENSNEIDDSVEKDDEALYETNEIIDGDSAEEAAAAGEINGGSNESEELNAILHDNTEKKFYREVIERKPKNGTKKVIALFLAAGLMVGTVFGFSLDNLGVVLKGTKPNAVYAAGGETYNYVVDKTVSPVVPIAKKVSPSIVAISIKTDVSNFFGQVYEGQGTGSGIIIDNQGHIVTNNHVVEGAKDIEVILKDGTTLKASLVGTDPSSDLAVIKVDGKNLQYAELGDSSQLEVGELAVAIGSPMGTDYAGSVTAGIISGLNRKVNLGDKTMTLIQTDAAINPGNSGGALVNSAGQVIGINSLKLAESNVEGMGFAIPINEAKPIVEELIKNGKIARPFLGISGIAISKSDAQRYKVPQGIYVQEVVPMSGADRAGISRGDIITKADGKAVTTFDDLSSIIKGHKIGDVLKVEVYNRDNKTVTLSVTLTENNSTDN